VNTANIPDGSTNWNREIERAIGRALLYSTDGESLTAAELAAATGRDPSNLKKAADAMVEAGLLTPATPSPGGRNRGRRPRFAYALPAPARASLERSLAQTADPGRLEPGQQLVFAELAAPRIEEVLQVIGESQAASQAAWSAVCDGDRQEYVVAFGGDGSAELAVDLMAALSAAEVRVRRTSVSQIRPMAETIRQVRRAARAAERARLRRRTRQAGAA